MDQPAVSPIVVGIDGSKHAIRAAVWAVDEAVSRDAQLLLIYIIDPDSRDLDREYAFARKALHKAWTAAEAAELAEENTIKRADERLHASRPRINRGGVGASGLLASGDHPASPHPQAGRCRPVGPGRT